MKVNTGRRWSIHRTSGFLKVGALMMGRVLTDADEGVVDEFVGRDLEVARRRPLADAAGEVVLRAVAATEPAAEFAARIAGLLTLGDAAEMRADADDDQPFGQLHALLVRLRVGQRAEIDGARLFDLLGRAPVDEHRLAAPDHRDALAGLDAPQIDLRGGQR